MRRVAFFAIGSVYLCVVVASFAIVSGMAASASPLSATVNMNAQVRPPNDDCANSTNITDADCPITLTQNSTGATDESGEPPARCPLGGPGKSSRSVWYGLTSTTRAIITVSTCGSSYDTVLSVYAIESGGPCDFQAFAEIICNDDFNCDGSGFEEIQSRVRFTAQPSILYKIQVTGFDGASGQLMIRFDCSNLKVVFNEIQPRGPATAEWIELRNNGSNLARLNGWTVSDNSGITTRLPPMSIAPADKIVIAAHISTFTTNHASFVGLLLPLNFPDFTMPGVFGNGLDDAGDCLKLRNELGEVIDAMSYGTEGGGHCAGTFPQPPASPPPDQSLQRNPNGYDSDQGSDWMSSTPNPGGNSPTVVVLKSFTARGIEDGFELDWETISEADIVGFNIARGEQTDGPFMTVNSHVIEALAGGSPMGVRYQYTDRNVEMGKSYVYALEAVSSDGSTQLLGIAKVESAGKMKQGLFN